MAYRPLWRRHVERSTPSWRRSGGRWRRAVPPDLEPDAFLQMPPSREEAILLERATRSTARWRGCAPSWRASPSNGSCAMRSSPGDAGADAARRRRRGPGAAHECAEVPCCCRHTSAPRTAVAETLGFEADDARAFATPSPFPLEQRPIVYRPVGALSRASLPALEPALFARIVSILGAHPHDKGLIHVPSYAVARRLMADVAQRARRGSPADLRRVLRRQDRRPRAASRVARAHGAAVTVAARGRRPARRLPALPDRHQDAVPGPGRPVDIRAPRARSALVRVETAKALCRPTVARAAHAEDHGVTYVLDAQFERFLQHNARCCPNGSSTPPTRRCACRRIGDMGAGSHRTCLAVVVDFENRDTALR